MNALLQKQDKIRDFLTSREGIYGITAAVALISAYSLTRTSYTGRRKDDIATVPYTLPLKGSTEEYRANPRAFIEKYAKLYGPVYRAYLFGEMMTVVSDSYVREIFLNDDFNFITAVKDRFDMAKLCNCANDEGHGIADLVKRCLNPRLDMYTERVNEQLEEASKEILTEVDTKGSQDLMHMYILVQHMVARASATVFVGPELAKNSQLIDSFKNMVIEVGSQLNPKPWLEPFPRLNSLRMWYIGKTSPVVRKHRSQLRSAVKPSIDDRLARQKSQGSAFQRPDDLLQDIIERHPNSNTKSNIYDYVVDTLTALIFAALHTTSENSTVVLYRLLQHPELMDELVAEQDAVLVEHGLPKDSSARVMTRQIIKQFEKLDSVCRESFRIRNDYLGLSHTYEGKKDFVLSNGAIIKPGEKAIINIWGNHRRNNTSQLSGQNYFGFDPYRFVKQDKQATKISEDFLLFGLGKHACPGRFFAVQEAKVLISVLLRSYKLSPIDPPYFSTDDSMKIPAGRVRIERR